MPGRITFAHYIEKAFGISSHKHMHKTDKDTVELDLKRQAANALTKAIGDYIALNGQEEPFVKVFLQWFWVTMDGQGLMNRYAELPMKMKPKLAFESRQTSFVRPSAFSFRVATVSR